MKQKQIYIIIAVIVIITGGALAVGYTMNRNQKTAKTVSTYDECIDAGYPMQNSKCMTPEGKSFEKPVVEEKSVTREGRVICLIHKDPNKPHTLECAIGLQVGDGKNYALDLTKVDNSLGGAAESDQRVRIKGMLKEESSKIYKSDGTINVESFELIQ